MSEHNRGRQLTIRLTITEPSDASWIWDTMIGIGPPQHGVQITAVQDGDLFKEFDEYECDCEVKD